MLSLEELFCRVDDCCQAFESQWQKQLAGMWSPASHPSPQLEFERNHDDSHWVHQLCYRNFKAYDQHKVQVKWACTFPGLVSYHRFVEWMPSTLVPLCAHLRSCFGNHSDISLFVNKIAKVRYCLLRPGPYHQHQLFPPVPVLKLKREVLYTPLTRQNFYLLPNCLENPRYWY
jgi:hypothetical protein